MGFMIEQWDFTPQPAQRLEADSNVIQANHWYHCERQHPDIRDWLLNNQIPKSTVKHLLADESRPSFHQYDEQNFMLILRGMNMNQDAAPEDMLSVRILFYNGALISTRKVPSRAIMEIRQALAEERGPKQLADLIIQIIDGLNGKIDQHLETVENRVDELDIDDEDSHDIIPTQKALLAVKRFIRPQQYAIRDLAESDVSLLASRPHQIRYALNNITRINETIDFYLGELELFKEELHQRHEEKVSQNSYLFTVVATIFLPTSFLTGLLGINIGGMPGVESPMAFTWFCIALIAIFGAEWLLLRRLRFVGK